MDFCLRVTPPLSNQAFLTTNEGGRYADQILLKVGEPGENKAFFDQLLVTDKEFTQLTVNVGDFVNPTTEFLGVYWLRTEFWVLTKKLKKSNKNDFCLLWMTPPDCPVPTGEEDTTNQFSNFTVVPERYRAQANFLEDLATLIVDVPALSFLGCIGCAPSSGF